MRHVLLATALLVGAASAHAQPAPAKVRMRTVLDLAKRKDASSILAVSHAVAHDPEPVIRRLAALALERMIDASTGSVELGAGIAALTTATRDPDQHVQATAARALGTVQRVTAPKQPSAPPARVPPIGGPFCTTSASLPVRTENLTSWTFDMCAAFNRASANVTWPAVSTSNGLGLRVSLVKLQRSRRMLTCNVTITTASYAGTLSKTSGGARVEVDPSGVGNRSAAQDCVDAVLADMLNRKVVPQLGRTATPSSAQPASAAPGTTALGTTVPGTTPGTTVPGSTSSPSDQRYDARAKQE